MKKLSLLLVALAAMPVLFAFTNYQDPSGAKEGLTSGLNFTTFKTKTMTIEKEILINKSIEDAWQVLGPQFADVSKWASPVSHSEGSGDRFNGATCTERGCSTTLGALKEKLLEYSPADHHLKYQVKEGMPSMVKYATNTWRLESAPGGQTRLILRADMEIGGFTGALMKPMMQMKISKICGYLAEEFKYYVEHGKPHPRKVKAMAKAA